MGLPSCSYNVAKSLAADKLFSEFCSAPSFPDGNSFGNTMDASSPGNGLIRQHKKSEL